jgi:hypothetical protein
MKRNRARSVALAMLAAYCGCLAACSSAHPAAPRGAAAAEVPATGPGIGPPTGSTPPPAGPSAGAAATTSPAAPGPGRGATAPSPRAASKSQLPCPGSALRGRLRVAPAIHANQRTATVGLVNTSKQTCTVNGYPDLQLLGAGTDPISTMTVHAGSAAAVRLAPGATAWATLRWSAVASADEAADACQPAASRLAVFAPHDTTELDVAFSGGRVCQHGRIQVGAFGARAPQA